MVRIRSEARVRSGIEVTKLKGAGAAESQPGMLEILLPYRSTMPYNVDVLDSFSPGRVRFAPRTLTRWVGGEYGKDVKSKPLVKRFASKAAELELCVECFIEKFKNESLRTLDE